MQTWMQYRVLSVAIQCFSLCSCADVVAGSATIKPRDGVVWVIPAYTPIFLGNAHIFFLECDYMRSTSTFYSNPSATAAPAPPMHKTLSAGRELVGLCLLHMFIEQLGVLHASTTCLKYPFSVLNFAGGYLWEQQFEQH